MAPRLNLDGAVVPPDMVSNLPSNVADQILPATKPNSAPVFTLELVVDRAPPSFGFASLHLHSHPLAPVTPGYTVSHFFEDPNLDWITGPAFCAVGFGLGRNAGSGKLEVDVREFSLYDMASTVELGQLRLAYDAAVAASP